MIKELWEGETKGKLSWEKKTKKAQSDSGD
jgi:hypothetical protein